MKTLMRAQIFLSVFQTLNALVWQDLTQRSKSSHVNEVTGRFTQVVFCAIFAALKLVVKIASIN